MLLIRQEVQFFVLELDPKERLKQADLVAISGAFESVQSACRHVQQLLASLGVMNTVEQLP